MRALMSNPIPAGKSGQVLRNPSVDQTCPASLRLHKNINLQVPFPNHLSSTLLPPPRPKYLRRRTSPLLLVRILQVDPVCSLDIHRQRVILPVLLPRPPRQVHVRNALAPRSLDVEAESHVLGAPLVRLLGRRKVAIARQPAPRGFAVGADLGAWAEQALAFGVGADGGGGAVEVCGFGGGGEDVGEEEVGYAALGWIVRIVGGEGRGGEGSIRSWRRRRGRRTGSWIVGRCGRPSLRARGRSSGRHRCHW